MGNSIIFPINLSAFESCAELISFPDFQVELKVLYQEIVFYML